MFRTLADKGINIQVISTSEIKVSVLIGAEYTELAVRALHTRLRSRCRLILPRLTAACSRPGRGSISFGRAAPRSSAAAMP